MSRQKQDGLHYFSFDTDFFYADKRIKRLHSRYGNNGLIFYIYLLTEIYRNGYYARWDDDIIDDALGLNLTEGFIEQVMSFFIDRGLIVKIMTQEPNNPDTVITSPGIQRRYQEAVKGLRRDIYVNKDIWLLEEEETATYIKFTQNNGKSVENKDKCRKNSFKSGKNNINEIKLNKKKINSNIVEPVGQDSPDDIGQAKEKGYKPSEFELKCVDFLIQSILNELPNQKVPKTDAEISKWAVHINRMQRIDGLDMVKIWNTLVWTMQNPFWRTSIRSTSKFREKFQTLYLQSKQSYQNSKKNPFTDYKQNDYDFSELEKELLSN